MSIGVADWMADQDDLMYERLQSTEFGVMQPQTASHQLEYESMETVQ